eukprot:gnl/MRDRNA2_/MRDRNA2_32290_c0_seq1.p1 gnl/MRDRNA2_/MRDRNA2_32290_c0~~gnl/MRDRNA2_/MRDRNA2_32290_c0_seq1.p1  ORF type:complete len:397 (+),score=55.22 gnl/MRDRNA2_/MRDRNA2_32290_c0_seq1:39-1229(+)
MTLIGLALHGAFDHWHHWHWNIRDVVFSKWFLGLTFLCGSPSVIIFLVIAGQHCWIFIISILQRVLLGEDGEQAREVTFREERASDPLMDSIEEQLPATCVVEAGSSGVDAGQSSSSSFVVHDEETGLPQKGIATFQKGEMIEESEDNCCSICLAGFAVGDLARRLPCGHAFHRDCVDAWLVEQGGKLKGSIARCPVCRTVALNLPTNPLVALEGDWVRDHDSKFMGRIEGGQLEWMNGSVVQLRSKNGRVSVVCGTITHTASCGEDGLLRWSDGDVWRRTSIMEAWANAQRPEPSYVPPQIELQPVEGAASSLSSPSSPASPHVASNVQGSRWFAREANDTSAESNHEQEQAETPEGDRSTQRLLPESTDETSEETPESSERGRSSTSDPLLPET